MPPIGYRVNSAYYYGCPSTISSRNAAMTVIRPDNMTRVRDLPEKMSVSRKTMYNWFAAGLKRVWIGSVAYVTHDDLAEFARIESTPPPVPVKPRKSKILARLEALEARKKSGKRKRRPS